MRAENIDPISQEDLLRSEKTHVVGLRGDELKELIATSDLFGLALSGGGIRSATFALGVIQALAHRKLLRRIDYLSCVSGGGYIGSWLSACIYHAGQSKLGGTEPKDPAAALASTEERISPACVRINSDEIEPREIRFLRAFSSYLTPRLGLLSGDTLALLAGSLRNFMLNIFLFVVSMLLVAALIHDTVAIGGLIGPEALGYIGRALMLGSIIFITVCLTLQSLDIQSLPERNRQRCRNVSEFPRTGLFLLLFLGTLFVTIWLGLAGYKISFVKVLLLMLWTSVLIVYATFFAYAWADYHLLLSGKINGTLICRSAFAVIISGLSAYELLILTDICFPTTINSLWRNTHVIVFGPGVVIIEYWILYLIWIMVVGISLSEYAREWLNRMFGLLSIWVGLWVLTGAICIYGRPSLQWMIWHWRNTNALHPGVSASFVAGGIIAAIVAFAVLAPRVGPKKSVVQHKWRRAASGLISWLIILIVFCALIIIYQSLLLSLLPPVDDPDIYGVPRFGEIVDRHITGVASGLPLGPGISPSLFLTGTLGALVLVGMVCIDVNTFSLQNLYRNRLVRCYLGAANEHRAPEPFSGFDPNDDLELAKFRQQRPYLLCNATLNISRGQALGWQQRKAAAFLFSPCWCGYWLVSTELNVAPETGASRGGYVPTEKYVCESASFRGQSDGIMVGTAMATSGAAISSQMGFASREARAFLLTLLNLRLGRWFPNSGSGSKKLLARQSPPFALFYYVKELLGMTTERSDWIYVSDGGHFENLGIYELVKRRCRRIICVDAGADPQRNFGDLGNAIQKCRVDFGVDISIDTQPLLVDVNGRSNRAFSIGTINYPEQQGFAAFNGELIYIKPSIPIAISQLPADILSYRERHPEFPHEPTHNQWFSETQFESYRKLGYIIGLDAIQTLPY